MGEVGEVLVLGIALGGEGVDADAEAEEVEENVLALGKANLEPGAAIPELGVVLLVVVVPSTLESDGTLLRGKGGKDLSLLYPKRILLPGTGVVEADISSSPTSWSASLGVAGIGMLSVEAVEEGVVTLTSSLEPFFIAEGRPIPTPPLAVAAEDSVESLLSPNPCAPPLGVRILDSEGVLVLASPSGVVTSSENVLPTLLVLVLLVRLATVPPLLLEIPETPEVVVRCCHDVGGKDDLEGGLLRIELPPEGILER